MVQKPVLVTGGAGFVGGHLLSHLVSHHVPVLVIDDLSTGKLENLPQNQDLCRFIHADVCDESLMSDLILQSRLVIHLAAVVGMKNVVANPMRAIRTNVETIASLAELCSDFGVPLVDVSSSAVYHSNVSSVATSFCESDSVHGMGMHPASTYSESKSLGELICDTYRRTRGLKCLIVRPFNLIGPRQASDYGMVVPRFVRLALAGEPLPIYGDGTQTRTFSDVRQAISLLWAAIDRTSWNCDILNLATNDQAISIIDLANLVSSVVGRAPRVKFTKCEAVFGRGFVDVPSRRPDLSRLRALIGEWEPVPLSDTLGSILEYELNHTEKKAYMKVRVLK